MVAVLDRHKRPLDPCSEKRARLLLERKRARVHRIYPVFTICLIDRLQENSVIHPLHVGMDPGSKVTGVGISMPLANREKAIALMEIEHRGDTIKKKMNDRRAFRRNRRNRRTRYRKPRFLNRTRPEGWLPPSIMHRVNADVNFIIKLKRYFNIRSINIETAQFDTQKMMNPEISGVEYQQGELQGFHVREYILEKFGRRCVYCGKKDISFEIDHVIPKSKGGSDRVSNLVLACHDCNSKKDNRSLEEFCPEKAAEIRKQLKAPLRDTAVMNSIRKRLLEELKPLAEIVTSSFGYQTKWNRKLSGVPKAHCLDGLFSGEARDIQGWKKFPIMKIRCMGRGTRSRTLLDKYGFPRAYLPKQKRFFGFMTGDIAKAIVTKGKKTGTYMGRVAVRSSGRFNIDTGVSVIQGLNHRCFSLIQRGDGYRYRVEWLLPDLKVGVSAIQEAKQ